MPCVVCKVIFLHSHIGFAMGFDGNSSSRRTGAVRGASVMMCWGSCQACRCLDWTHGAHQGTHLCQQLPNSLKPHLGQGFEYLKERLHLTHGQLICKWAGVAGSCKQKLRGVSCYACLSGGQLTSLS